LFCPDAGARECMLVICDGLTETSPPSTRCNITMYNPAMSTTLLGFMRNSPL